MPSISQRILFKPIEGIEGGGCHADVYLPVHTEQAPIALMFHGGGFAMGTSDYIPLEQVQFYLDKGFIVISSEYRLLPHAAHVEIREDLLDAYKWIISDMKAAIGCDADTTRVIVMGWSAGGTAALLLAADVDAEQIQSLKAVITTYPLTSMSTKTLMGESCNPRSVYDERIQGDERDLVQTVFDGPPTASYSIADFKAGIPNGRNAFIMAMFKTGISNTLFCASDPPYSDDCSAINRVTSAFPPTAIIHASGDPFIDPSESLNLHRRLQELGVESRLFTAENMGHGAAEVSSDTWPEGNGWWADAILPSLIWSVEKAKA